jgi:beta-barrel assembly-enhancing protease
VDVFNFQCHAFHDSLSGGKASGEFQLSAQGISYQVNELKGNLPFNQLHLSLGGASNRLIFIKHPLMANLTLYTSDLSLLKNPLLRAHPECAPQLLRAQQVRQKAWGIFAAIAFCIIALPIFALWNIDYVSGYAAKYVPVVWETKLGESVSAQYRITHKLYDKEKTEKLLKPLVDPLLNALPASPYKYQFTIVNESSLNAFALPGGFVTIHTGLILKADSAEELLGVLAHEISHVEQRHGVRSILGNLGIYTIASIFLGDVSGVLASVSSAAPMLMSQQYSRRFETDADEKAAMLLKNAKINPEGLPRFFEKMIVEEKAMLDKMESEEAKTAYKTAMIFLSTHPASEKRMTHLRELIGEPEHDYRNLDTEFTALKEAVKEFVATSPTETTEATTTETSEKENAREGNH